jgi:multidrug efflux pump subunit AcrA (membrane-fusion protein)
MVLYDSADRTQFGRQSSVAEGEPVREGQRLMTIHNLGKMQVVVRVPEALVAQVRPGQAARVSIDAFPGRVLRGQVSRVASAPVTRDWLTADDKVYPTVIAIDEDSTGLRPAMTATVIASVGKALDNTLAAPTRALIGRGGIGKTVSCLVLTADGPEEREVLLGQRDETLVEITTGLREGDEVIVNPQLLLNDLRDRIRLFRGSRPLPRRGQ